MATCALKCGSGSHVCFLHRWQLLAVLIPYLSLEIIIGETNFTADDYNCIVTDLDRLDHLKANMKHHTCDFRKT